VINPKAKEGIILVNKPKGITSHDVVDIARRKLKFKKIGHAGTLDPLAEGLLIILVGRFTKMFPKFVKFDKKYFGVLKLGETTATGDSEGQLLKQFALCGINRKKVEEALKKFKL